jgi:hypothetical protein
MGRDDLSVVDAKLRFYGVRNLRIADGSINADHHHAVRDHRRALGRNPQRLTLLICEAPPDSEWRERADLCRSRAMRGRQVSCPNLPSAPFQRDGWITWVPAANRLIVQITTIALSGSGLSSLSRAAAHFICRDLSETRISQSLRSCLFRVRLRSGERIDQHRCICWCRTSSGAPPS